MREEDIEKSSAWVDRASHQVPTARHAYTLSLPTTATLSGSLILIYAISTSLTLPSFSFFALLTLHASKCALPNKVPTTPTHSTAAMMPKAKKPMYDFHATVLKLGERWTGGMVVVFDSGWEGESVVVVLKGMAIARMGNIAMV
jgi:hypothetical protein